MHFILNLSGTQRSCVCKEQRFEYSSLWHTVLFGLMSLHFRCVLQWKSVWWLLCVCPIAMLYNLLYLFDNCETYLSHICMFTATMREYVCWQMKFYVGECYYWVNRHCGWSNLWKGRSNRINSNGHAELTGMGCICFTTTACWITPQTTFLALNFALNPQIVTTARTLPLLPLFFLAGALVTGTSTSAFGAPIPAGLPESSVPLSFLRCCFFSRLLTLVSHAPGRHKNKPNQMVGWSSKCTDSDKFYTIDEI